MNYSLGENSIENLGDFLLTNFDKEGHDFSKVACIFGGRRPHLFLRRNLAKKIKKPFYPPASFTIDEFMVYIAGNGAPLKMIGELDAAYLIYCLAKNLAPSIFKGRENFGDFLPWSREIHSFIEQIDLEDIKDEDLEYIEKSASIGYDIPENINMLLKYIIKIRHAYQDALDKGNIYSRGRVYLEASRLINKKKLDEFKAIVFCNFFYLHKTELQVMKEIYRKGKGTFIFSGSSDDWSVLNKNAKELGIFMAKEKERAPGYGLYLYQGFDMHSQVCWVREILSKIKNKENTVIVVPRAETLIPLLTEVSSALSEFNVSMGYPLKRTAFYVLFYLLAKTQKNKKGTKYYTKEYFSLISHPLIKNLNICGDSAATRVMVHKIEELLKGKEESTISGSLFLSLDEIENEETIYSLTAETLENMGVTVTPRDCKSALIYLHNFLFRAWEENTSFSDFSKSLEELLKALVEKSKLASFPFNLKVVEKIFDIKDEFQNLSFSKDEFNNNEIWEIFQQKLDSEEVSLVGSPLRGVQILGLFETRSLCFENVIVLDMNESVFPKLKIYEPLIPREVMLNLGLNRLEKEEEIQRYQFNFLISGAKNVHLVYEANQKNEKSRFIEQLLWEKQKDKKTLNVINIPKAFFKVSAVLSEFSVEKTPRMVDFMKRKRYSASRINTYLSCPLRFYYQYVLGLEEKDDLLDEPEASHIGTFIHELLEEGFSKYKGKTPIIDDRFKKHFRKLMDEKFQTDLARRMKSDSFLLKRIIKNRLDRFLDNEAGRNVAKIICLEEKRIANVTINNLPMEFNYTVDRIDELEDKSIAIIDYKTGGADIAPKRLRSLNSMQMNFEEIKENIKSFQLPLYYHFVSQDFPQRDINAQLYNIRTLERITFIAEEDLAHKDEILEICLRALGEVFRHLFDINIPFAPSKEERKCVHCFFRGACK